MDRLLTDSEIREALQQETGFIQTRDYRYEKVIKTAQDAKTLKAVVKWVEEHRIMGYLCLNEWQDKLKEWGIVKSPVEQKNDGTTEEVKGE